MNSERQYEYRWHAVWVYDWEGNNRCDLCGLTGVVWQNLLVRIQHDIMHL